jgi:hypothetical protein
MIYEECYVDMIVQTPRKHNPAPDSRLVMAVVIRKDEKSKKVMVQWGLDECRQTDWYDPKELNPVKRVFHNEHLPKTDVRFCAALDPNGNIIAIERFFKDATEKAVWKYIKDYNISYDGYYGYSEQDAQVAEWLGYRAYEITIPHGFVRK